MVVRMSIRRIFRPIALNKQKLSTNGDSDIRLFLTLIELQVMRMRDSEGSYVVCVGLTCISVNNVILTVL